MLWRRIGVPIAVVVALLLALGRMTNVVVDWAWFSAIGYVDVFWKVLVAQVALFVVIFAVSALLLWANGTLAVRCASQRWTRLRMSFYPGQALLGPPQGCSDTRLHRWCGGCSF
jgi:uncharacterized membrane protein (UPF0182 family)